MAYDPNQQNEREHNPYSELTVPQQLSAPSSAALPGGEQAPSGTGHVNFDQIYNANAGVAAREAGKMQTSAADRGNAAQQGITGAQQNFATAARTGTTTGPTADQQAWAKYGSTGVTQPKKVVAAQVGNARTGQQGAVTEQQEGLTSNVTRTSGTPTGGIVRKSSAYAGQPGGAPEQSFYDGSNDAATEAAVRQGAASKYGGPNALSAMAEYSKLAQDAAAAQDESTALASGNEGIQAQGLNQLDASLLGASGRKGFEQLGQRYGGLKGQLDQANVASKGVADTARKQTDDASAAYKALLGEHQGHVDADQTAADAANAHSDSLLGNAGTDNAHKEAFNEYLHGGSGLDKTRNVLHGVFNAISPSEGIGQAIGEQGFVQRGTNALSPMSSTNKGNVWGGWNDDDYEVWAGMSDSDWNEFAGLDDKKKRQWIEDRKAKLKGGK